MRIKRYLLAALLSLIPGLCQATTVTLTGVVMNPVTQAPLQGQACFNLPIPAIDTSTNRALTAATFCYRLLNGTFPAFAQVVPNDVMQPLNMFYVASFLDRSGLQVMAANYVIPTGGGSFNIGLAIPTNVTTAQISFLSPASLSGNNTFTGLNTFTQQVAITVAIGTPPLAITSTTLVPNLNINVLNGVTVTGTPTVGSLLQATSASAANWTTVSGLLSFYTNSGSGTGTNLIAKLTGAPSTAVTVAATDSAGAIGICSTNCTTTGSAGITTTGQASCVFDGATVAGDYVQISTTVAGNCHDVGNTYPGSGQVLGRVLSTNGAGGTYNATLFGTEIRGAVPAVTNLVFQTATLGAPVTLTNAATTNVLAITTAALPGTCATNGCRAWVCYSEYSTNPNGNDGGYEITTFVNDGTNSYAVVQNEGARTNNTYFVGNSACALSTTQFSSGAIVTFTLKAAVTGAGTGGSVTSTINDPVAALPARLTVAIQTSN